MIVVCEPVCWGLEHVPLNAALLEMIRLAFPSTDLTFYGEASHVHHVRTYLSSDVSISISWNAVPIPLRHARFVERWYPDFKLLRLLLRVCHASTDGHLLLTSCGPATLVALKLLLRDRSDQSKAAQVILHGNLTALNGWRSRNPVRRMQDLRTALRFGTNRNLQYILLEEPIREVVLRILPFLEGHVVVLDHPIPPNERPKGSVEFGPPYRFGFLGMATEAKGFRIFNKAASSISSRFPGLVEFHAIGWTDETVEMGSLTTKPSTWLMSRAEYIRQVEQLHFVCLPYQGQHYELSPSGVLLDAVAWEKPLIASRIPIMENLVSRFGDIGYLCAAKDEFCDIIKGIIERADENLYKQQVSSMREVRRSRTPQYLASSYRDLHAQLSN